ncbi:MAG: response regulator, partial [Rhodanobacteraceae bacterium]
MDQGMDKDAKTPFRVLLAEDDPVSRAFLEDAIRACGGEPEACADGVSALQRARAERWDLLILDHRLPGLDGDKILAALRAGTY